MPSGERWEIYCSAQQRRALQLLELGAGCLTTSNGLDQSPAKQAPEALKGRVGEDLIWKRRRCFSST